jgi:ribosomal protein L29
MKFKELQERSGEELDKMLGETREKLRALRAAVAVSRHPKVRDIRVARQTLARILTLLSAGKKKA